MKTTLLVLAALLVVAACGMFPTLTDAQAQEWATLQQELAAADTPAAVAAAEAEIATFKRTVWVGVFGPVVGTALPFLGPWGVLGSALLPMFGVPLTRPRGRAHAKDAIRRVTPGVGGDGVNLKGAILAVARMVGAEHSSPASKEAFNGGPS